MDLKEVLKKTHQVVDLAQANLLKYFGQLREVREKRAEGLVSEADVTTEKIIRDELLSAYPDTEMLGEEGGYGETGCSPASSNAKLWIVDPLDGTTNYVHGFPVFCISVGLQIEGEVVLGVIDAPLLGERYWAIRGDGAYCNGKRIQVSQTDQLSDALVATGFPTSKKDLHHTVAMFENVLHSVRAVRRPGAAAYDLCMVASGKFDMFWERELKPWDIAAGSLFVEEAGGSLTNYTGGSFDLFKGEVIAGNKVLSPAFVEIISNGFGKK